MKFDEIPGQTTSLRIRRVDGESLASMFPEQRGMLPVTGLSSSIRDGEFEMVVRGNLVTVTPTERAAAAALAQRLSIGSPLLAELGYLAPDDSALLTITFFSGAILPIGDIDVAVDEHVIEQLEKRLQRHLPNLPRAMTFLEEATTFSQGNECYFFVVAGPAVADVLGADFSNCDIPTIANSICLIGNDFRFVITSTALPDGRRVFVPSKITTLRKGVDRAIRLASGRIRFVDWSTAGEIRLRAKAALTSLSAQKSSYLRKWDEYGQAEFDLLQRRARAFGPIRYSGVESTRDNTVIVKIEQASDEALEELSGYDRPDLDFVEEVPEWISGNEIELGEFESEMIRHRDARKVVTSSSKNRETYLSKPLRVKNFIRETKSLELDIEALESSGWLIISIRGEVAQMERRHRAREAIQEGRSANSELGLLIEEKGEVTSLRRPQRVRPLSAFVREKVFTAAPTPTQVRAIEVALNTPDIALIQGPPGTGKTTVIAAIVERLNEMAIQSGQTLPGQVLLSGFQHDAVENLINRLSINGLPVPKFGKRQRADDEDGDSYERNLGDWCEDLSQKLRAKYPQLAEYRDESEIRSLYLQYEIAPTSNLERRLLERILHAGPRVLGGDLFERVNCALTEFNEQQQRQDGRQKYLGVVRSLRIRKVSFADDGPERADDALFALDSILEPPQRRLLEKAARWRRVQGIPPFLDDLRELKETLLKSLTERPIFSIQKHNDRIMQIAELAVARIRDFGISSSDREMSCIAEFLAQIDGNPHGVSRAVENFSFAYSATVQQSVSQRVQKLKGVSNDPEEPFISYEYVILDEAARISPRDLMVAMAQGERIILVGDHRQLPHIFDEEVARQMELGDNDGDLEHRWLEKSMFEYLFSERLEALEAVDGIQRRVTLDQQFRMHPELGDFVSRNFYERFASSERFESIFPAAAFQHDLPGTGGRPAMWLDVPLGEGAARRSGTSWQRQAEADSISSQLLEWLGSEQGRGLTFGVIAFYRAQAELIQRALKRMAGEAIDDKKVKIGTVDSFQGMEFDVVFLSVVRTKSAVPNLAADRVRRARQLFGHLCLHNRLNVAMSRQKRLLVVAGDSALLESDLASEFIPSLVNFRDMAG